MENSLRLKDISKELGVNTKDMMQALRELGITVKSQMGSLTEEEATRVREKFRQGLGRSEVVSASTMPGVIVRRRTKSAEPAAKDAPVEPVAEAPSAAPETPVPVVEEPQAPQAVSEPVEEKPVAPAAPRQSRPAPTMNARIIEQPKPAPAVEEPKPAQPEPEPVDDAGSEASEPEVVKLEEPGQAEPVLEKKPEAEVLADDKPVQEARDASPEPAAAESAPETSEAAQDGDDKLKQKKKKPKREVPVGPQVRIISMPAPAPAAPPAAPRPQQTAGQPAPGRRPEPRTDSRPAAPGAAPSAPPKEDDSKKKRKKDKRVVEFSPFVSEDEGARSGNKRKRVVEVQDKTGGKGKGFKKKRGREDFQNQVQDLGGTQPQKAAKRKVRMEEALRVSDMAKQMGVKAQDLIKVLLGLGLKATINQSLDVETAVLAASEFGYEVEKVGFSEDEFLVPSEPDRAEDLLPRPPVVTIMGHVDHGKTSLLDAIRATNVTSSEAGGITQHIGAYHVKTSRGNIVFLDTPGHEAFTAMRARGAQVTDIVVLVVAADDGVMDQTREAVNHSRAAGVPIVVAVNKIDKPDSNPDRVKRELADLGLVPEDWGGDTIFANVSAKQKLGLDSLLELIQLQAEVLELRANPNKRARGHIVEARLDKGRGPVATVLIQEGSLKQGDAFVCGLYSGRVRAMFDDQGKKIKEAGPAIPVEIQGLEGVPDAGDEFVVLADEKTARRIAEARLAKQRERDLGKVAKVTLETFLKSAATAESLSLNLVLKADVQGSLEAIADALNKLSTEKVKVRVIHSAAGSITESDVLLATASQAIIIGFNVRPTLKVKEMAEQENVEIRFYDIIYQLVGDVKDAMAGMLAPVVREVYLGQAEVRETFNVPKVGMVAGCGVLDGKLTRNAGIRLLRDGVVIYTGKLSSLRRFKDDVKEVTKGYECGVGLENYSDIKVGDHIEAFENVEEKATLE